MTNARDVVSGFQQAMAGDDWAKARTFLADDLRFHGPFESFDRPEPYLEALRRLHSIVEDVRMHHVFADGDEVAMFYDLVTNTPAGTAPIAEWHSVRNGRISEIRVVFDPRPFAPMMAQK